MRFVACLLAAISCGLLPPARAVPQDRREDSPGGSARGFSARRIRAAVEEHIRAKTRSDGGVYLLADEQTGETLRLEFVRLGIVSDSGLWGVHDPNRPIEGHTFVACVFFHPEGAPENKLYDVDFQLRANSPDAKLEVSDVRIHKVPRLVNGTWIPEERPPGNGSAGRKP